MPTATVSDVKEVIETNLSDSDINDSLAVAEELNDEYNDTSSQTTVQTKNIERWAAVVNIRQYKERGVEKDSVGDYSATYEGDELDRAKSQLLNWLRRAGGDTSMANVGIRDSSRHTTKTDIT